MALALPFMGLKLMEGDVPGAKINLNDIVRYKHEGLKRWLQCRGPSSSVKNNIFVKRLVIEHCPQFYG